MTDPRIEQLARKMCGDLSPDDVVCRYGDGGRFSPRPEPSEMGPRWRRYEEAARLAIVAHEYFTGDQA